jgi:hypothetical protein
VETAAAGSKRKRNSSKVREQGGHGICCRYNAVRAPAARACTAAAVELEVSCTVCGLSRLHRSGQPGASIVDGTANAMSCTCHALQAAPCKRPAVPSSEAATPAATAEGAGVSRDTAGHAAPSSAGHTPMDRFGFGGKATPPQVSRQPPSTPTTALVIASSPLGIWMPAVPTRVSGSRQ